MKELTLVANKYNTDKGSLYGEGHRYTEFYDQYFQKYKCKCPRILEIGLASGGSLKAYNDYFHGQCDIIGIDINPALLFNTSNIETMIVDQSSREALETFVGNREKFDIIIDDGSHENMHQQITLYYLHKLLNPGGIYIIEDLHTFSWEANIEDTTLFGLMFSKYFSYLTPEENEQVFSKINDITIWSNHVKQNKEEYPTSLTSVITF